MRIIEPQIEHFESIWEVYSLSIRDAFEKEGLGDLQDTISEEISHKKESLLNYLNGEIYNKKYLIALEGEEVVGTISFGPCGKQIKDCTDENFPAQIELGGLYIKPSFQNQGIGSSLINKMIKEMKNMGIHIFSCDSGYKRAQKRWIRKFGEPYLVAKDYWGEDGDHMIWLCKSDDFINEEKSNYLIRKAEEDDFNEILGIFNYFIENSMAAYRDIPVKIDSILAFEKTALKDCFKVIEHDNKVVGFGALRIYSDNPAFKSTAILSYFIMPEYTGKGLGSKMLKEFIDHSKKIGITNLLAQISSENEKSIEFHKKHGFKEVGRLNNIGVKFGREFDVVWMQKK